MVSLSRAARSGQVAHLGHEHPEEHGEPQKELRYLGGLAFHVQMHGAKGQTAPRFNLAKMRKFANVRLSSYVARVRRPMSARTSSFLVINPLRGSYE